jgi:SAM-dependent methyltransferase
VRNHSWLPKAISQKTISGLRLLPLYYFLQKRVGRLKGFHPNSRIEYAAKLYADVRPYVRVEGATLVEVGTGWVPVLPLALHIMGAGRIVTFDLNRHLQEDLTLRTVALLHESIPELIRRAGVDPSRLELRLRRLREARDVGTLFKLANITYHSPADASQSGLPDGSVDVVYSNLVLEHVTPQAMRDIHIEAKRVLKPTGVCWHNVDYSDHYAVAGKGLSAVNFLRYSQRTWDVLGQNDILWQNRWRHSQYCSLFEEVGFTVIRSIARPCDEEKRDLAAGLKLHADFAWAKPEDLNVLGARVVLRQAH